MNKISMLCPEELVCEEGECDTARGVCVDEEDEVITVQRGDEQPKPLACQKEIGECARGECRQKDLLCVDGEQIVHEFFYKITYGVRAPQKSFDNFKNAGIQQKKAKVGDF